MRDRTPENPRIVCIVDDDDAVRVALARLLRAAGLEAETYASPREFLERAIDTTPRCLLLDVHLPKMDGFELHREAVERGYDGPVIFITAHPGADAEKRAATARATALLAKPFREEALLDALDDALERARESE